MASSQLFFQFITVLFIILKYSYGFDSICNTQETCENCLSANINCAWCTHKNYSLKIRCMTESELSKAGCNTDEILKNDPQYLNVKNEELQDFQVNNPYAQVKPQKIKMKLIKSHTQHFKMTYRPAENNPLDLYFLMDLTWSMKDDKNTLINIGEQLAMALEKLTKNFRLGYGSFADKPIMPMISPTMKSNPCRILQDKCEPTYGYHHHLPLTRNIHDFIKKVNSSKVTGNLDNLEGGLDALMQVIVCSKQIDWNDISRKIVLFATDGLMHFAGDGLLAGIVQKNDKKCHLEKINNDYWEYTGSLTYDYPSLEEIYRELIKRKIGVIFAVTNEVADTYNEMKNLMKDISEVGILKNDSSNILDLIKRGYERFVRKAQFKDNSPSYIKITYETDCGGGHKVKTQNFCDDVHIGKEIDFYINITLTDFPNDNKYNHMIKIEESGISEFLEIDLEIQKPCPCEEVQPLKNFKDSRELQLCNNHGNFSCGMCKCDEGWLGADCSCNLDNFASLSAMEEKCKKSFYNNENSVSFGLVCSNHGECECGKCYCYQGYTGKYCECRECRKNQCDKENSECICGECVCKHGWIGDQCNCPNENNDNCIAPLNGEICMNHGKCKCGKCYCEESYFGKFCEINIQDGSKLCSYYEPCVKCLIKREQQISDDNKNVEDNECINITKICSNNDEIYFNHTFVENILDSQSNCLIRLENQDGIKCDHYYEYDFDLNGISHIKIKVNECLSPLKKAAFYGAGIFVGTILFGLLILCFCKCWVDYHDKIEYAKFEEQIKSQSIVMENAIYKSPMTYYEVPKLNNDEEYGF